MLKQLQHKRFTTESADRQMRNDLLSLTGCYWYVQAHKCIEPIGNVNDSNYKRPWYIHE
jgi:hypothetical protein